MEKLGRIYSKNLQQRSSPYVPARPVAQPAQVTAAILKMPPTPYEYFPQCFISSFVFLLEQVS